MIGALLAVKDIFVSYRKNETILFLLSLKRYFCHPKQSIILRLGEPFRKINVGVKHF